MYSFGKPIIFLLTFLEEIMKYKQLLLVLFCVFSLSGAYCGYNNDESMPSVDENFDLSEKEKKELEETLKDILACKNTKTQNTFIKNWNNKETQKEYLYLNKRYKKIQKLLKQEQAEKDTEFDETRNCTTPSQVKGLIHLSDFNEIEPELDKYEKRN